MKPIVSLLLSLLLTLFCLSAVLAGEPPATPVEEKRAYILQAEDGRWLALEMPSDYQPFRPDPETDFPCCYAADQPETGCCLKAQLFRETEKARQTVLRKVRDPSNGTLVWENVTIGDSAYLVYTGREWTNQWCFLLLSPEGYDFRFWYILPEPRQEMPPEAVEILASLKILPHDAITAE